MFRDRLGFKHNQPFGNGFPIDLVTSIQTLEMVTKKLSVKTENVQVWVRAKGLKISDQWETAKIYLNMQPNTQLSVQS